MFGEPVMDGTVAPGSGISAIGPGQISPIRKGPGPAQRHRRPVPEQRRHGLRFGGSITKNDTEGIHTFPGGGTWTFAKPVEFPARRSHAVRRPL